MSVKRVLSVSQLNAYIKGVFEDELILHSLCVSGEIEEVKVANGTTYFTLCEDDSRLPCVMFSVCNVLYKGLRVEAEGGVRFYAKAGRVSFVAKNVRPAGEGAQHLAFLQMKDRLEKEGLFAHKKPFPRRIVSVAVVTSETGAVIHDFVSVLRAAFVTADIKLLPVRVQGAGAADGIKKAAEILNRHQCCDVAVFLRGGGAEADLEAFNTETAARAIASCCMFTVSAVGHETNLSLCDLAADLRAGTPSIAAQMIADRVNKTRAELDTLAESLAKSAEQLYNKKYARLFLSARAVESYARQNTLLADQRIRFCAERLGRSVSALYAKQADRLRVRCKNLADAASAKSDAAANRLETASYRLDAQSPLKMLAKGYARAEKNGVPVKTAAELAVSDRLDLYYSDGKAAVSVTGVTRFKPKSRQEE